MASRYTFLVKKKKPFVFDDRPNYCGYHDGDIFFYYRDGKRHYAMLLRRKEDWYIDGRGDGTTLSNHGGSIQDMQGRPFDFESLFKTKYIPIKKHIWLHKLMALMLWNHRKHHFAMSPAAKP